MYPSAMSRLPSIFRLAWSPPSSTVSWGDLLQTITFPRFDADRWALFFSPRLVGLEKNVGESAVLLLTASFVLVLLVAHWVSVVIGVRGRKEKHGGNVNYSIF